MARLFLNKAVFYQKIFVLHSIEYAKEGVMRIFFTKMQALGNDYIYINAVRQKRLADELAANMHTLAPFLCDRHFGIGGDGIIIISDSGLADFRMMMYNSDGSRGKMCGNGIRCVGKLVYDLRLTHFHHIEIETDSGIRRLELILNSGSCVGACVSMGKPVAIGSALLADRALFGVNVGNNHISAFCNSSCEIALAPWAALAQSAMPEIENANVELCEITGENRIRMRVFENGTGETLSCGTGACAATFSAVSQGFCNAESPVIVEMDGGFCTVSFKNGEAFLEGEAIRAFSGEIIVPAKVLNSQKMAKANK